MASAAEDLRRIIRQYEEGVLTTAEFPIRLLQQLTSETTEDFSHAITPPVLDLLLDTIDRAPIAQDEWDRMGIVLGESWTTTSPEKVVAQLSLQTEQEYRTRFQRGAELLRAARWCLFPNSTLFSPSWQTSTAVALASQMYESRDFGAMPILADALQDAGCDNADVLVHCRGSGPHVRGCWVVDLLLGKK
ncbi:hypothetical protein VT84_08650 [Gemmata sp. SH-PL17]|uniref:hypothetical protein n=1 Tax=Gemmata sp. SH-PL17 TaxID=1630693 RepID=UPI0006989D67|nr:hypothetical protein [Gemmata sp. SH-PL17]AMV24453.1 hypothetical protein VT84_08650 [Gemmata sp. SH-PL17]